MTGGDQARLRQEQIAWLGQHADRDDYDLTTAQDALDDAWRILAALSPAAAAVPDRAAPTEAPCDCPSYLGECIHDEDGPQTAQGVGGPAARTESTAPHPAQHSRRVSQALRAADKGEAYHWPTIAAVLAREVRRLAAPAAPTEGAGEADLDAAYGAAQAAAEQWAYDSPVTPSPSTFASVGLDAALPLLRIAVPAEDDPSGLNEWLRGNARGRDTCHVKAHADLAAALAERDALRDTVARIEALAGAGEGVREDWNLDDDFPGWADLTPEQKGTLADVLVDEFWRGYRYEGGRAEAEACALAARIEALCAQADRITGPNAKIAVAALRAALVPPSPGEPQ